MAIYEFTVYFKMKHCAMKSFEKVTELSLEELYVPSCSCPVYGRCLYCGRRSGAIRLCSLTRNSFCHIWGARPRTVDAYFCIRLSVCILLVRPFEDSEMTTSHRKFRKKIVRNVFNVSGTTEAGRDAICEC